MMYGSQGGFVAKLELLCWILLIYAKSERPKDPEQTFTTKISTKSTQITRERSHISPLPGNAATGVDDWTPTSPVTGGICF